MTEPLERPPRVPPPDPVVLLLLVAGVTLGMAFGLRHVEGPPPTYPSWEVGRWPMRAQALLWVGSLCLCGAFVAAFMRPARRRPTRRRPSNPLCHHCLRPYAKLVAFCPRCAAPVSVMSMTAPYERIHAAAWVLGRAVHHPRLLVHVLVIVTGATLQLVALVLFARLMLSAPHPARPGAYLAVILEGLWTLVFCLLGHRALRSWFSAGPPPHGPYTPYGVPPWWSFDSDARVPPERDDEGEPPPAEPPASPAAPEDPLDPA